MARSLQFDAERRGRVRDKLNSNYNFTVSDGHAIDAFRRGNKTKFVNHDRYGTACVKVGGCSVLDELWIVRLTTIARAQHTLLSTGDPSQR